MNTRSQVRKVTGAKVADVIDPLCFPKILPVEETGIAQPSPTRKQADKAIAVQKDAQYIEVSPDRTDDAQPHKTAHACS